MQPLPSLPALWQPRRLPPGCPVGWFVYETAYRLQRTTYQLLYGHLPGHRLPSRKAQRKRRLRKWRRQGESWHPLARAVFADCGIERIPAQLWGYRRTMVLGTFCPRCRREVKGLLLVQDEWVCKFCGPVRWYTTRDKLAWASARLAYAHRLRLNGWMLEEARANLERVLWPVLRRKKMPVGPVLLGLALLRVKARVETHAAGAWRREFRLPGKHPSGMPSWVQTTWGPAMVAALAETGLHPTAYRARWLAGRWD